jgi:hypothetical protein
VGRLAAVPADEGRVEGAASLWAATERYANLRGAHLGMAERKRYLARKGSIPAELITAARERWQEASAAEVGGAAFAEARLGGG